MIATCLVILGGGATLAWMAWNFQVEAQRRTADLQGLVPVTRDFAPGQAKPADVLFRVAGSSALGERVMPELVQAWMRAQGYGGLSAVAEGRVVEVSGSKDGREGRVLIVNGSAAGGFEAMIQSRVEAVMSTRRVAPGEADRLSAKGDLTSAQSERIIGLDATLVLVNRANPLDRIGQDVLASILAGEITDWSEVDPAMNGPIALKLADLGPETDDGPQGRLLGDKEPPEGLALLDGSRAVADAVARDANAIGLARRDQAGGAAKALSLGERNARSVGPDDFAIATESYGFAERAYLYVASSNVDPEARAFADFAASPAGQEVVGRSGLTPQIPAAVQIVPPPEAPRDYAAFARDARRMNFDIRFDLGSNKLDAKAVADIARFADFIRRQNIDERRIALLGFADNVGAAATNRGLAQSRAETAGIEMERRGVNPGIIRSYGDAMPVGANAEERGRIRNRRVEVWLCAPPACPLVDLVAQAHSANREIPSGVRLGPPPAPAEGVEAPKG